MTLHAATFSDVVGLAAEPLTSDQLRAETSARLVLVEAMELAWQRAKYGGHQYHLLPADPVLVGLNTLQHWLWQRLQTAVSGNPVAHEALDSLLSVNRSPQRRAFQEVTL
jgi:hypothetical protein